jgi:hypothetical protein
MSSRSPLVPKTIPPVEEKSEQFLPVKGVDPEHLIQAFKNSLEHSNDTSHGVTGLTFSNYTVTVHKRKGLSWHIECKFKPGPRRYDAKHEQENDSRRDRPEDGRKAS